jgi:hypothetical protein
MTVASRELDCCFSRETDAGSLTGLRVTFWAERRVSLPIDPIDPGAGQSRTERARRMAPAP